MTGQTKTCQRPECGGTYEDVGGGELYCDTCGMAPVVSPNGLVASPPTGVAGPARAAGGASGQSSGASRSGSARTASSRSSTSRRSVSGRLSQSLSGPATRSMSVRSSSKGSGTGSGRGRLGAGLVSVPDVPRPDPRTVVLENPEVPERKRFCSRSDCGAPVGRARGGRPGRTEGFCTKCGHPYSFVPKLRAGDIVHGQYEVAGCLAHGGLGWIYLAVDRAVSDRWVVLKGLLDTGDEEALAVAVSERRFLAEIEHSNIVRIYNFVEHLDTKTGSLDGYIVMEYVGGKSLKEIANERRTPQGRRDPLPVEQACAYGIEALEALSHLHSRNLLYCDFKVDNAIQQQDQLKLIDMGAVRRMDDHESSIYGTVGYQAPEIAEVGPSVASDLYTVARTLAVLTFDFQGYTNVFADSLPDPGNIEVFRRYESFYRLLVRATDPDPARRFASAEEMAEQLTGVLREVVALQSGEPRPALSQLFGPELRVVDTELLAPAGGDASLLGGRVADAPRRRVRGRKRGRGAPEGAAPVSGLVGAAPGQASLATRPAAAATGNVSVPAGAVPAQAGTVPAQAPYGAVAGHGPGVLGNGDAPVNGTEVSGAAPGAAPTLRPLDTAAAVLALPVPRVDPADPNAGFLAGLLAAAPAELLVALRSAPVDSLEVRLREVRARLEMADTSGAQRVLRELETGAHRGEWEADWRVVWYRGLASLAGGDKETAALSFDAVYDAFPGEPAPKLALGICAEVLGQLDNAAEYYRLVWSTDHSYVSAAFGLARVRLASGDRPGAVRALEAVPESSIHFTAARIASVRARLRQRPAGDALLADLHAAARQIERLADFGLDAQRRETLATEVLGCALDWVLAGRSGERAAPGNGVPPGYGAPPGGHPSVASDGHARREGPVLLGSELDERGLRFGLERSYRLLARLAQRGDERIELVERANRFRPRTWV